MELPIEPPIAPMLAKLARELPVGEGWWYEPKWDGFRCLAFRGGADVALQSRNERPLGRYFPELIAAFARVAVARFVVDGEIVVVRDGSFDFDALMTRLHPSSTWVERHAAETPAAFVAFDLLALDGDDLTTKPFSERRARLEELLAGAGSSLPVTPATTDPAVAASWLERFRGGGIDGVVAKPAGGRYLPGKRAMVKVKHQRTADCVVAGFRWLAAEPAVSSLLLGAYDDSGTLHHVGVATSFRKARRVELVDELRPFATELEAHPWHQGFALEGGRLGRLNGTAGRWTPDMALDWVPLEPRLVCEVAYDQLQGRRFRHPARFVRWRVDRDPRSCTLEQFEDPPTITWPAA